MQRVRYEIGSKLGLAVGILVASGCTAAPQAQQNDETLTSSTEQVTPASSTVRTFTVPSSSGLFIASVTANGTGCPKDSWDVSIDATGQTFTLTFSKYETAVNPGEVISIKDCQIGVKLHSPNGLSWAVDDFYYSGVAFLDSTGMTGSQTAGYYFQGNPIENVKARTLLAGPFPDPNDPSADGSYIFADQINIVDLVWSPCGTDRLLNIPTRIILKNNSNKTGTGYINTLAVDGAVQLMFDLQTRTCP